MSLTPFRKGDYLGPKIVCTTIDRYGKNCTMESYRRIWLPLSHFSVQIPHYFYWLATVQAAQRLAQRRSGSTGIHLKEAILSLPKVEEASKIMQVKRDACVC